MQKSMLHRSANLVDTLLDRALKTPSFHQAGLDHTTLGKPSHLAIRVQHNPYFMGGHDKWPRQTSVASRPSTQKRPTLMCPAEAESTATKGHQGNAPAMPQPMRVMGSTHRAVHTAAASRDDATPALVAPAVVGRRAAILAATGTATWPFLQDARAAAPPSSEQDEDENDKALNKEIDAALKEKRSPPVFDSSSERALKLAKHLKKIGAVMYGAYWCSHCYAQKSALGKEAMSMVKYVECSNDGEGNKRQLCKDKKVPGYPTWEINGQFYGGEQTLEELERFSKAPA